MTTAQGSKLISFVLDQVTREGIAMWMGASEVYWNAQGGVIKQLRDQEVDVDARIAWQDARLCR